MVSVVAMYEVRNQQAMRCGGLVFIWRSENWSLHFIYKAQ